MLKGLTPHKRGRKSKRNPQDDEIQKLRRENQRLTELRTGQEARIILPSFRPPFALDSIDDVTKILLRQVEEVFISYNKQRGKKYRSTGTGGRSGIPNPAEALFCHVLSSTYDCIGSPIATKELCGL